MQEGMRQAAIRIMDTNNLTIKNVITKPRFSSGRVFKQDIQLRPSSNSMNLIGCTFYIADVGDMTWRKTRRADSIRHLHQLHDGGHAAAHHRGREIGQTGELHRRWEKKVSKTLL